MYLMVDFTVGTMSDLIAFDGSSSLYFFPLELTSDTFFHL